VRFERIETPLSKYADSPEAHGLVRSFKISGVGIEQRWPEADGWCLSGFRLFPRVVGSIDHSTICISIKDGRDGAKDLGTAVIQVSADGTDLIAAIRARNSTDSAATPPWLVEFFVVDEESARRIATIQIPQFACHGFEGQRCRRWPSPFTDAWDTPGGAMLAVWSWNAEGDARHAWRAQYMGPLSVPGIVDDATRKPLATWKAPVLGLFASTADKVSR
jgi:hypothetical protein